jgi:hypothetical protein
LIEKIPVFEHMDDRVVELVNSVGRTGRAGDAPPGPILFSKTSRMPR